MELIIFIFDILLEVKGDLTVFPKDQHAFPGSRVILECSTDLDYKPKWTFKSSRSDGLKTEDIYYDGEIVDKFTGKGFKMNTSLPGQHDLIICNVKEEFSGLYNCHDKEGLGSQNASATLLVQGIY